MDRTRQPSHFLIELGKIGAAIEKLFIQTPPADLMRRIASGASLADDLRRQVDHRIHGQSVRVKTLKSLRLLGLVEAADEIDAGATRILNDLSFWEKRWADTIRLHDGDHQEAIDWLGENPHEAREQFANIESQAVEVVESLRLITASQQSLMPKLADAQLQNDLVNRVTLGDHPQIVLEDGNAIALKYDTAVWLKALIDCGDWMSGSEFNRQHPELGGNIRADRLEIPEVVKKHVDSQTGKGARWLT